MDMKGRQFLLQHVGYSPGPLTPRLSGILEFHGHVITGCVSHCTFYIVMEIQFASAVGDVQQLEEDGQDHTFRPARVRSERNAACSSREFWCPRCTQLNFCLSSSFAQFSFVAYRSGYFTPYL